MALDKALQGLIDSIRDIAKTVEGPSVIEKGTNFKKCYRQIEKMENIPSSAKQALGGVRSEVEELLGVVSRPPETVMHREARVADAREEAVKKLQHLERTLQRDQI